MITTIARNTPDTTDCTDDDSDPTWLIMFWMTLSSSTPARVPTILPRPPTRSVPPITTAEIALSSSPTPTVGTPEDE